jgi:hypothetical protein
MKTSFKPWLPLLLLVLAMPLVSCRQAPLKNLVNHPVAGARNDALAASQVRTVILEACRQRGWVAREISPGLISATIQKRKHRAQVEIPYTGTSFSIIYKDSTNLNYHAGKHSIHNQYNNWVDYLRQDIESGLARI